MRKFMKHLTVILACVFAFSAAACNKGGETPEENGGKYAFRTQGIDFDTALGNVSDYKIIVSSSATETEKYAAEQVVKYVYKVSGATVSYAADGKFSDEKVISIGKTEFSETSGVEFDETTLGNDGFVIKNKDSALIIRGGGDRGTLYGAYDFLEYQLGVKWLTADTTYIPETAGAQVYASDRTEIPAFDYRVYLDPSSFFNDSTEFTTARRFTSEYLKISESAGGNLKWYQGYGTHNSLSWVNTEKYVKNGKIDPVYTGAFSNDGNNVLTHEKMGGLCVYAADVCYTDGINEDGSYSAETTNEDGTTRKTAIGMAIEGMTAVIGSDKEENNYYMFGQTDITSRPCLCSRCIAASRKYGDSGIMIRFINALADGVKEYAEKEKITRDIDVVTFAYLWSAFPPVKKNAEGKYEATDKTCVPRDNVTIRLAPITMNRFVPYKSEYQDVNAYGSDYMEKWAAICNKFMVWDYTTYNPRHYWWYPAYTTWRERLTDMKKMGVGYAMLQSNFQERTIYQTIFEGYVASKMLWNPEYDMNELISEFNKYYFGKEAGKLVDEYVALMTAKCYEVLAENEYRESAALSFGNKGLLKSAIAILDEAIENVNSGDYSEKEKSEYIERLEIVKFQPRYMYLYNYMEYETDEVQMNIEAKKFILEVMAKGGVYWAENELFDAESIIFK